MTQDLKVYALSIGTFRNINEQYRHHSKDYVDACYYWVHNSKVVHNEQERINEINKEL